MTPQCLGREKELVPQTGEICLVTTYIEDGTYLYFAHANEVRQKG